MADAFADHFSEVAKGYATYRPRYPSSLFAWLARMSPARNLAWDCAAGGGQATLALADHFTRVIATDASAAQISTAPSHPKVEYRVAPAESSALSDHSVDLVTVAQAAHWLDLDRFYGEVRRVLVPGGLIALWAYGLHSTGDAAIDRVLAHFYRDVVGPYWPPARRLIEEGYRTLPFPFAELTAPPFEMEAAWTLAELAGYLRTWSATVRYRADVGTDPVIPLEDILSPLWGDPGTRRRFTSPIALRVGSTFARAPGVVGMV